MRRGWGYVHSWQATTPVTVAQSWVDGERDEGMAEKRRQIRDVGSSSKAVLRRGSKMWMRCYEGYWSVEDYLWPQ